MGPGEPRSRPTLSRSTRLAADAARPSIRGGLWLDGISEIEPGNLSAWVAGSAPFVGVRVALDGTVTAGTVRSRVDRASFAGAVGFVTGERGGGFETTDGGLTWSEIDVPASADIGDAPSTHERGCTPVGASIGSWVRIGWGKSSDRRSRLLPDPQRPSSTRRPSSCGRSICAPTGESEGPAQASRRGRRRVGVLAESRQTPAKVTAGGVE